MPTNPVLATIRAAFNAEIANPFTVHDHTITVDLPHGDPVAITVLPLSPSTPTTSRLKTTHTYHYTHQDTPGRLVLHNLTELRAYQDDVCQTLLNARYRDGEVTFPDGTTYLLTTTALS